VAATDPGLRREPTGELVRRLIDSVQALLDKQVALVKQEIREDISQVVSAGKTLAIGAGLLFLAAITFLHFLFLAIDTLLPRWGWLAALVLTLLLAILGGMFAKRGIGLVKVQPLARTRETLKEDAEWVKHPLTPNGKSSHSETSSPQQPRS
jgi:hypothetical protein